jgi:hypothetical protein
VQTSDSRRFKKATQSAAEEANPLKVPTYVVAFTVKLYFDELATNGVGKEEDAGPLEVVAVRVVVVVEEF